MANHKWTKFFEKVVFVSGRNKEKLLIKLVVHSTLCKSFVPQIELHLTN